MKGLKADSSSPLYHQLMLRIAADIDRGTYPVGSRIPPEHELEQLYQRDICFHAAREHSTEESAQFP